MGLERHPLLGAAGTLMAHGDSAGAWRSLAPLVASDPQAALVGGAIALQAGDTGGAIDALESLLSGPKLDAPSVDGAVVFAFSDEGMIVFDVNSLAGVGLLVYAYARAGRSEEAVELASTAHAVVGAEGFLAFELLLLRDAERWEDLLQAAKRANPDDRGRFETELLRARALEGSGRLAEAFAVYSDLADIEADLPWVAEAQRRREHLRTLADSGDLDIEPAEGDLRVDPYVRGADPVLADVSLPPYDHLAPYQDLPTRDDGPIPRGPSPAPAPTSRLVSASLSLGAYADGLVLVLPLAGTHSQMPPATWVELLEQERVEEVLQRLDAVIAAEPRVVGFRRRPDPDQIAAKHWQRVLAALFSAISGSADSPERLARVESPESREFAERLGFWLDAMVTSVMGELRLLTSGGIESVVLPLVARLHARGEVEAARRWVEWALEGAPSPALRCAEVALAFRIDDDAAVVRLTDRLASGDDWTLVMQTYRARALQRMGRAPAARQVLDDVVKLAARLDDEGDLLVSARYLRSRAAILNGRVAQAMDDLHGECTFPRNCASPSLSAAAGGAPTAAPPSTFNTTTSSPWRGAARRI